MRMVVSANDTAIMFMPNSPTPPRGTTSRVPGGTSGTTVSFISDPASMQRGPDVLGAFQKATGHHVRTGDDRRQRSVAASPSWPRPSGAQPMTVALAGAAHRGGRRQPEPDARGRWPQAAGRA